MIKDKLAEAVEAGLKNIKNGDDHIPLNMRGELEVVVKDRDGNIISYERGHNQVTNLAKMAIIHLLAGELGVIDSPIYSVPEVTQNTGEVTYQRTYSLESAADAAQIFSWFDPNKHTSSTNEDGTLISGEQYFFNGSRFVDPTNKATDLSQVYPLDVDGNPIRENFPTKMLFGTGMEASESDSMKQEYMNELGGSQIQVQDVSTATILRLNGVVDEVQIPAYFFQGCSKEAETLGGVAVSSATKLTNWYSNTKLRSRTLQPATSTFLGTTPSADYTSIRGAIKNCFITGTGVDEKKKYNGATKMAYPQFRGYGYPCFIYAKRSTLKFWGGGEGNHEVNYQMNSALGTTSPYETEITYTVDMPAQPVNSTDITSFYPYNGWILKQAGLFSDSRFQLRSENNKTGSQYTEAIMLSKTNSGDTDDVRSYRDSVGGQMLFTRNLSSPILKTPDNQVTFYWHIFITI